MGIVQLPVKPVGQEGILPATKFMVTTDLASTIQAPGYLNSSNLEGTSVSQGDIIEILYNYNVAANSGITGFFFVSYVSNLIKLNKVSSNTVWTDLTITAAQLATAGKVIVQYAVPGQLMVVRNLIVVLSTGLSGGGGDRLLALTDGTSVYNSTGITAALLGTPINTVWGGTGNPLPAIAMNTATVAGANLYFQYAGGTTDFTTGSVKVSVLVERIG